MSVLPSRADIISHPAFRQSANTGSRCIAAALALCGTN
jgi:hypothetical protein